MNLGYFWWVLTYRKEALWYLIVTKRRMVIGKLNMADTVLNLQGDLMTAKDMNM